MKTWQIAAIALAAAIVLALGAYIVAVNVAGGGRPTPSATARPSVTAPAISPTAVDGPTATLEPYPMPAGTNTPAGAAYPGSSVFLPLVLP